MAENKYVTRYIDSSNGWPDEMRALRSVLLDAGLDEDIKWMKPTYSADGANIVIMQEMNDFLALMFFKGILLEDPQGVLEQQGENTHAARRLTFRSVAEVEKMSATIAAYVAEAIDVEQAGIEVPPAPKPVWAAELQQRLDDDPEFNEAFSDLTPGRQREYNLHFTDAKQSATRTRRIEKYYDKILDGKGMRE